MASDRKQAPVGGDKSELMGRIPKACADEEAAVELLEELRFGDDPYCPRCGSLDVYKMTKRGSDERNERYLWRCYDCSEAGEHDQYTVRTGTVMEQSKIPLEMWVYAFWRSCSSKKGISAMQVKRETGLSYPSAWFLMHRVREAMRQDGDKPLSGTVEADETYIGGKSRKGIDGRGSERKTPVMVLVERDGEARAKRIERLTADELQGEIRENVDRSSRIMTDEWASYKGVGEDFEGGHAVIRHGAKEYVVGEVHTNTAESYFALLKRGINGTFHHVSDEHLDRYCDEFDFRWKHRNVSDGERTAAAIRGAEGKRLMYRTPADG